MADNLDILILEDEKFIALDIEASLHDAGYSTVRVCTAPDEALAAIDARLPDLGLLDINLGLGRNSFDVARKLKQAGCIVAFMTGYTSATVDLPDDLTGLPRLSKPFDDGMLLSLLDSVDAR